MREFAVLCLENLTHEESVAYCVQLVQVLKYERHHYSPLALLLLKRAIEDKDGEFYHSFVWNLKSEISQENSSPHKNSVRYKLILEAFFSLCGEPQTSQFLRDFDLVESLKQLSLSVRSFREKETDSQNVLNYFRKLLQNLPK